MALSWNFQRVHIELNQIGNKLVYFIKSFYLSDVNYQVKREFHVRITHNFPTIIQDLDDYNQPTGTT